MNLHTPMAALITALALSSVAPGWAGEGHDHGDAPTAATGSALPRFAAVSESFELVGILNGKQLTLYLDRAADNSPVPDAQIELEIGAAKYKAEKHGDAEYEVMLSEAPKPGVLPITATVVAGNETDLLAGELDLHEDAPAEAPAHAQSWMEYAGWAAGGVAALAALGWFARRKSATRQAPAGGAA